MFLILSQDSIVEGDGVDTLDPTCGENDHNVGASGSIVDSAIHGDDDDPIGFGVGNPSEGLSHIEELDAASGVVLQSDMAVDLGEAANKVW